MLVIGIVIVTLAVLLAAASPLLVPFPPEMASPGMSKPATPRFFGEIPGLLLARRHRPRLTAPGALVRHRQPPASTSFRAYSPRRAPTS